jgi:hypothetical protein
MFDVTKPGAQLLRKLPGWSFVLQLCGYEVINDD